MKQLIPSSVAFHSHCYEWKLSQKFAFEQRGTVTVQIDFNRFPCTFGEAIEWNNYGWVSYMVLIFCTVHLILVIRYINEIGKRYKVLKKRYQEQYESHSHKEIQKGKKREDMSN